MEVIHLKYFVSKRILFLVSYPLHESPSQGFRFEQYFALLNAQGCSYTAQSFLNSAYWKVFFKSGKTLSKVMVLAWGFVKRMIVLFKSPMYDFVLFTRKFTLVSNDFFKKDLWIFDDTIWRQIVKNYMHGNKAISKI